MALPECASSSTLLHSFGLCSPSHSPFEMIKAVLGVGVMMCVSSCLLVLSVGDLECVLPNLRKTAHNALLPLAARTWSHLRRRPANLYSALRKQHKVKQAGRSFLVTSRQRGNENVDEETYKHGPYRKQVTIARKNVCVVVVMVGCVTLPTENKTRDPCTGLFQSPSTS